MRPYEVMIVLDAGLDEEVIRSWLDKMAEPVHAGGGRLDAVDRWGKRQLAYEVGHRKEGYYVVARISAEPQVLAELDRMLHLADEVIRHKVIRLPEAAVGLSRPAAPVVEPASQAEEKRMES